MAYTEKLICPIMTAGWLSNNRAKNPIFEEQTNNISNMISCQKDKCPLWNKDSKSCNLGVNNAPLNIKF